MNDDSPAPPPASPQNPWPRAATIVCVVAMLLLAAVLVFERVREMPGKAVDKVLDKGLQLTKEVGAQAATVARAFREGTMREEFMSRAVELEGTSYFQFATLKQHETFKREESGSTAFGWVPLPKIVVQAQAPVEYSYHLDFEGDWRFEQAGNVVTVFAPPIIANTPALDPSALTIYTLEGSIWRDEAGVRERLRLGLSASLKKRAAGNVALVREIGRRRLEEFVEKWLGDKFSDGREFQVKVVFPDEQKLTAEEKRKM